MFLLWFLFHPCNSRHVQVKCDEKLLPNSGWTCFLHNSIIHDGIPRMHSFLPPSHFLRPVSRPLYCLFVFFDSFSCSISVDARLLPLGTELHVKKIWINNMGSDILFKIPHYPTSCSSILLADVQHSFAESSHPCLQVTYTFS